ncbi:hypothetical protein [Alkalicoccobacillus gibsonii]|jgi:uncharacterized membrane protein YhaH (DUF805 family)|uniref:Uncharacterized protein n=1 Tax=Alkalicoccobacillus gibsonii TaxID=79881 RepID=A0ABU9VJU1_9BACI|nr:hypothetical protein [Alkalicoccobacillus gibsonii]MBM0067327.1 hypothetical protein [Alkalicoccobacillus gibsonii]
MTKIQISQVIAILVLIAFMYYTYQTEERMLYLFIPIAFINILLWIMRQRERKMARAQESQE